MELIRQPNGWSCNACAWAMVLGLTLEQVIEAVGHDGSHIWDSSLSEPNNRVGFADEELSWLAVQRGYACTEIALEPTLAYRYGKGESAKVKLCTRRELAFLVHERCGVFTMTSETTPSGLHAVAWDGEWVYDSMFGVRPLSSYQTVHSFLWVAKIAVMPAVERQGVLVVAQ